MNSLTFGDSELRECLASWPTASNLLTARGSNPLLERLRQVLSRYAEGRLRRSHVELIALIRQWLLFQARSGAQPWLSMPEGPTWPDRRAWEDAAFTAASFGGRLEIQASKPRLDWLGEQGDLFDDVFDHFRALNPKPRPAEPIVADPLGLPTFTGDGQREAVRSLIHMPEEITLIVALPTGCGKSLLAQLPPLLQGEGHLTLAIVPTVALAIDQGKRMAALLKSKYPEWDERHPLAYHGDLTQEERSAVFRAVRNGAQRILFTSPEAATGSLRNMLDETASHGSITHVVVDEAHLVASWGSGFRPAFQLLPALIARLRATAPRAIRVVLASATLTPHTVQVLQRQFGPADKTRLISGLYLRPEPRYAARYCHTSAEQILRAVEALKAAPRPFILYVTRPAEADQWLRLLKEEGFERIAAFTGATRAGERKTLLGQWERNELDGMIATSAFGLGVDKNDVRTIMHATFPESLDRFYQEVGRSGRDGIASASLLLFTSDDIRQAVRMSGTRYIGDELGFQRWTTMIDQSFASPPGGDEIWIDLHRLRPELNVRGKTNLAWNLRTLNLMAAAGLIEITALSANGPHTSGMQGGDLGESETAIAYAAVRLPNGDHRSKPVFEERMQHARSESKRAAHLAFQLMRSIARNERPVEDALKELYRVALPNAWGPMRAYCGGCQGHWSGRSREPTTVAPFVGRLNCFSRRGDFQEALRAVPRTQENLSFVVVDDVERLLQQSTSGLIDALVSRLRPHTIALARGTSAALQDATRARLRRLRADTFIDLFDATDSDILEGGVDEVRLIVWSFEAVPPSVVSSLRCSPSAMTVMIIPRTTRDPDRPDRLWSSVLTHSDEESVVRALTA
jgi:ATP-dependent DNA helicase RecQ